MNKTEFERIGNEIRKNPQILDTLTPYYKHIAEKIWLDESNKSKSNLTK